MRCKNGYNRNKRTDKNTRHFHKHCKIHRNRCNFAIAGDTRKLTKQVELQNKQMELLNKQIDYLLQLEERKQGINQNPSQNVRQNTPQNFDGSGFDTRQ